MKINISCPTRGRPQRFCQMWQSALDTATKPDDLSISVYIDYDDILSQHFISSIQQKYSKQMSILIGGRIPLSDTHNKLYTLRKADIVQFSADDILFRTTGWDTILKDAYSNIPDKIALIGAFDGFNTNLFTHPSLHKNWINILGYLTPPYFIADWADTWIWEIASVINRIVHVPILLEHMHHAAGKASLDETYQHGINARNKPGEPVPYYSYNMLLEREAAANKLKDFIKNYGKIL